ncbi:hypothetical protein C1G87_0482 [Dehalococcoides mccartyi]|uniref:Uncharacterized protein n=1 Tax=Dehalococcoides mccartyi TaxID=61435 RepID=A0A328ELU4_9CHLR|nr:hypothetical protein C1G87_0482 [Dehalococcoides mccartyi]
MIKTLLLAFFGAIVVELAVIMLATVMGWQDLLSSLLCSSCR